MNVLQAAMAKYQRVEIAKLEYLLANNHLFMFKLQRTVFPLELLVHSFVQKASVISEQAH